MEDRCKKFVLETEKDIDFEVLKKTSDEIIIRVFKVTTSSDISKNYVNPPIPDGYKYICGEWNNGFVIERISDGSQFVWIPVGSLDPDGTHDGMNFNEKFGRRDYGNNSFDLFNYHGSFKGELIEENERVKKYGGFYISRFEISKSSDGKPKSIKGEMPWVCISCDEAKKVAASFEKNEKVKSSLTSGAAYDSVLAWLIKSESKNTYEIAYDSTKWGNFWITKNSPEKVVETGSCEEWKANNIYDLAGNIEEWTQEEGRRNSFAIRGRGNYELIPEAINTYTVAHCMYLPSVEFPCTGFRIALYIK